MILLLPFLRHEAETPDEEPPAEPAPPAAPARAAPAVFNASATKTNSTSIPGRAVEAMLKTLRGQMENLPEASLSVASVTERPLAVGNRRGMERFGSFSAIELKGLRLDAVVRFQFLADDPGDVETAAQALQNRLLGAGDVLWMAGFLRLRARETSPAEHMPTSNAWRKTVDYEVLYEYHYEDADGAESIIARIPIDIDSEYGERTEVTDEMVRWDNRDALPLTMSGVSQPNFRVRGLSILAFLAEDWNGGRVTLSVSLGGADRERSFASVREFRDAFELEEVEVEGQTQLKTVDLGGNAYLAGRMAFPNPDFPDPIILKGGEDVFEIRYADRRFQPENTDDTDSVVYLQVLNSH